MIQENEMIQGNDEAQENETVQGNDMTQENETLQGNDMTQENETAQENESNTEEILKSDFAIHPSIRRAILEMGFEQFTPIQEQMIPHMLAGSDVIGQAQTGTGKTAAFGIPVIQNIDPNCEDVQAIILCPTRELAIQVAEEMRRFARYMSGIKILPIYGGQDISKQIRSLKSKVSIVVGTPGRVMDHMRRHTLKLNHLKMVILDEADEMLNMGFREDIETILEDIPEDRQTALFSATMPKPILNITRTYQKSDAVMVKVVHKELTIPLVKQYYYEVKSKNKEEVTARLLDYYNPKLSLIFCNTKHMVDVLVESLKGRGYFAEGLHGDMSQHQRDRVMNGFRNGTVDILIATDVAARGIDVDDIEAVFNYDVPQDIEYYVHRIGRTGRAGRKGRAFTLVVGREIFKIREIEQICKTKMKVRNVPSAADVTAIKADKIFNEVVAAMKDVDMTAMIRLIEDKIEEEDITTLELAAAFLKMHMGEELKDIPTEKFVPERRRSYGKKDGRGDGRYRNGESRYRDDDRRYRDRKRKSDGGRKSEFGRGSENRKSESRKSEFGRGSENRKSEGRKGEFSRGKKEEYFFEKRQKRRDDKDGYDNYSDKKRKSSEGKKQRDKQEAFSDTKKHISETNDTKRKKKK